jgi:hypothetical protein
VRRDETQKGEAMTAGEILAIVDSIKANNVADSVKYGWLSDVEGMVCCEIRKSLPDKANRVISEGDELSVPAPYSSIYTLYLVSMIAFAKGDYEEYSSANAEFEKAFRAYAKFCIRNR